MQKYEDSEYSESNTFRRNFFNDWKRILGKSSEIQSLEGCDFTLMKDFLFNEKEKQKELKKNTRKTNN